ncbi:MAG TPA: DUF362 domain-containing protein [Myxococcota bacterium]|nr:DUF362 domain-containing protein [Myxococcota bacterium]HRY96938.1 DUF362 domain-containing protein [Myxococcota bacterium]HSA22857.1 DUF362 domain-containing protein [Myxococcota bacterium]
MRRRAFLRGLGAAAASGVLLGRPGATEAPPAAKPVEPARPPAVETNLADFQAVPRGPHAIPGPFPGRVVRVTDPRALVGERLDPKAISDMFARGLAALSGREPRQSFEQLFSPADVVGIKVNPVGPPLISTRLEVVDAIVAWLTASGLPRGQIVIWDRFEHMLAEAGFTPARYPGVRIEGLQVLGEKGTAWRTPDGRHPSEERFDPQAFYLARGVTGEAVRGYDDLEHYLGQHVFAGEKSFFGRLVTRELTKIINVPVFKNTGQGVSMATKNLGYGAICNTARLHEPLFFRVCTEVTAAPWIRDKLVLNVLDGLRGQYDGGPMPAAACVYPYRTLYFATDPIALDAVGHRHLVEKRRQAGVAVNEHPRFTRYLHDAEALGLGIADPARIQLVEVPA